METAVAAARGTDSQLRAGKMVVRRRGLEAILQLRSGYDETIHARTLSLRALGSRVAGASRVFISHSSGGGGMGRGRERKGGAREWQGLEEKGKPLGRKGEDGARTGRAHVCLSVMHCG